MPVFENYVDFMVRGTKALLKVEAGVSRAGAPKPAAGPDVSKGAGVPGPINTWAQKVKQVGRRMVRRGRALRIKTRRQLGAGEAGGIRAENVVWIFGAARTGSTWLSRMMGELKGQAVWNEPLVGALFGNLYYDRAKHLIGNSGKHYIFGDGYKESWLSSIRIFVLREASGRFPEAWGADRYLVIKEPNGSSGAPLLMEAMPESRMIFLIRDPRDYAASSLDAKRAGGWQYENRSKWKSESPVDKKGAEGFVRSRAKSYLERIGFAKEAYDAHKGPKVMVKYEELRADTLGTMKRIYSELEMLVNERELARSVEKHSWENIPEEEKGEGKFYRKAKPGSWHEDLTLEQIEIVESITAPLLKEFYSSSY
jgi:Sulfotransferase domain